jgi:hypothetical protein
MTTAVKAVEILTTLAEDPHVMFFPWQLDVHDTAAGMAKSIHLNGLLSEILTPEQWAAYPGNTIVDAQGQPQIAPRYTPPQYVEINNNMTSVELYVAKANNDKLQLWIDSTEALKRAVIKSLGKVVRQNIQEVRYLFQRMSVTDILARVTARYGQMQKDTRADLKERMLTTLPTTDGLDTHISNLKEMFEISNTAGFPVDEKDKVDTFRETVCGHPMLVKILETFDFDFPDARHVTFLQLTDYLTLHVPHLRHAQITATRAHANLVAATAYAALESESKKLRKELDQFKRKRTTQPPKNQNKQKNIPRRALATLAQMRQVNKSIASYTVSKKATRRPNAKCSRETKQSLQTR